MFEQTFSSLYVDTGSVMSSVTTTEFLLCCVASIVLGVIAALVYTFKHRANKNFVITLALMPLIVQAVITLVNGNLGAGIAVMGVFNLVRFRSVPGTAKDVTSVFMAMAIGLATGMGYLGLAALFTVIVCVVNVCFVLIPFNAPEKPEMELNVVVPEDLDYDAVLPEVLARYTTEHKLCSISSTGEGTQFKLEYSIRMNNEAEAKRLIDEIRTLNGKLKVSLSYASARRTL